MGVTRNKLVTICLILIFGTKLPHRYSIQLPGRKWYYYCPRRTDNDADLQFLCLSRRMGKMRNRKQTQKPSAIWLFPLPEAEVPFFFSALIFFSILLLGSSRLRPPREQGGYLNFVVVAHYVEDRRERYKPLQLKTKNYNHNYI